MSSVAVPNVRNASIDVRETGLIYRNPKPHLRAVHAMHPTLARADDDGTLVASFDLGQAPQSMDYAGYFSRSTDGGKTWDKPQRLVPPAAPGQRPRNSFARICRVSDGSLVGLGCHIYRDDPEQGYINPSNFGHGPMDIFLIRSTDGGRSWTSPQNIKPPLVGPTFEICHPVVELSDGRWLAPVATWKDWNGNAPSGMKAISLVSHDKGKTWPEYIDELDDWANGYMHIEQALVQLRDGRLLVTAWAYHEQKQTSAPTPYALSDPAAKSFGPARRTGLSGETPKMICLRDGRVLCLYRRLDKPGLWANLSMIDGDDWINLAEAPVWQGARSFMHGQRAMADELSDLKFGCPNLIQLPDGQVLAAFWCHEDEISVIRWVRIRCPE